MLSWVLSQVGGWQTAERGSDRRPCAGTQSFCVHWTCACMRACMCVRVIRFGLEALTLLSGTIPTLTEMC